jgi:NADPH2:quinone reductase
MQTWELGLRQFNARNVVRKLKAIRVHEFGPPEVMQLEDVPEIEPGPGLVVITVKAAGVNPADTYTRSGMYARKPSLPYTPGVDGAGIVKATGENVTLPVGMRVYISGTLSGSYAEQALCEAFDVHPLPEKLSFSQGAAINVPYATAYRALFQRAHALAGETVLVHGATGGVGIAALQIARGAGMRVIGTGGSEKGMEVALNQGASHVFDHRIPDHLDRVLEETEGRGVDIILEMLANVNLAKDLKILAPGGRVVVIGSRGRVEIDPRDTMIRDASILGMLLWNTPRHEAVSIHSALGAGLENGTLRPVVAREMPLSEAPHAHEAIMQSRAYGKIVLIP